MKEIDEKAVRQLLPEAIDEATLNRAEELADMVGEDLNLLHGIVAKMCFALDIDVNDISEAEQEHIEAALSVCLTRLALDEKRMEVVYDTTNIDPALGKAFTQLISYMDDDRPTIH